MYGEDLLHIKSPHYVDSLRCYDHQYKYLFTGAMMRITRNTPLGEADFVIVETQEKIFALRLAGNTTACNVPAIATEHPDLLIWPHDKDKSVPFHRAPQSEIDLTSSVNTKFLYSEIRARDLTDNLTQQVIDRRCRMERQQRLHQLQLSRDQPEQSLQGHALWTFA